MTISSRTPEGQPNCCPICHANVVIEPSTLFGDAPCPSCGSLLWFLNLHSQPRIFECSSAGVVRDRVIAIVAERLGVDPAQITEHTPFVHGVGADSLDTAELVMQLEEEFDLN